MHQPHCYFTRYLLLVPSGIGADFDGLESAVFLFCDPRTDLSQNQTTIFTISQQIISNKWCFAFVCPCYGRTVALVKTP